jgi:hypothetical protein
MDKVQKHNSFNTQKFVLTVAELFILGIILVNHLINFSPDQNTSSLQLLY